MLIAPGRATRPAVGMTIALVMVVTMLEFTFDSRPAGSHESITEDIDPAALTPDVEDADSVQPDVVLSTRLLDTDNVASAAASRFGTPEAIGDVNGDGIVDLAVGAFSDDAAGVDAGAVYVLFMDAAGEVASSTRITSGEAGFGGVLLEGGGFGFRIAGIGDLDGDAVPDIAVSAYRSDRAHDEAGEVWILFLNADGSVRDWQVITEGFANLEAKLRPGDEFGVDIAGLGDLDGDGVNDLAIGMWERDGLSEDEGGVLIVFLEADGTVKTYQEISAVAGWPDSPLGANSGFGASVERIGDINGDGVDDIAVGSIGVAEDRGEVWLLALTSTGTVVESVKIKPGTDATPDVSAGARFGSGVVRIDDAGASRGAKLAVGAFGVDGFTGAVWVLELNASLVVVDSLLLEVPGVGSEDLFGHTLASLGDIDGDGNVDLVVGVPGAVVDGVEQGGLYVVSLGPEPAPEPEPDAVPEPEPEPVPESEFGVEGDTHHHHLDESVDPIVPVIPEEPEGVPEPTVGEEVMAEPTLGGGLDDEPLQNVPVLPEVIDEDDKSAELHVVVLAPPEVYAGEVTELVMEVLNDGSAPAVSTRAQMLIPEGLVVVPASIADGCELTGQLMVCDVGELGVAQVVTRSFRAEVANSTSLINTTAAVSASGTTSATSSGTVAVLDARVTTALTDGLKSEGVAMAIVVLTVIVCGAAVLSATRREALLRG